MRVVFMGTPEFAIPPLEHLLLNQHEVVAVYTQPDKPGGRGRSLVSPPVKKAAVGLKLPVVQPASLKQADAVAQLADFHPDVIIVAAFGQLLPQPVLNIPHYGCINIHPSLLPKYRGASPVAAAILAGDEFTGVSVMLMDEGLDTGPVLARAQISVSAGDTTGTLTTKLSLIGAQLLQEVLVYWPRGEITPQSQNEAEATYTSPITKEEGEIDWHVSAIDIWRRVRAFQPWPGCYTRWRGRHLRIMGVVPLSWGISLEIGRVVALSPAEGTKAAFGVGTGDGVLGVLAVQAEGKRVMSAEEFLRGQRQFIGGTLG
ncbi:methionyl-tRNA formyltransferase [Chloroflexota bacterium]